MKRWCQAGAQHIWLRNNCTVQLCCSMIGHENKHTYPIKKPSDFIKIIQSPEWQNEYQILETGPLKNDCDICLTNEQRVGDSQRIKLHSYSCKSTKFFLKIDFSNKCNLKCTMCGSSRSTSWIKDEIKMNDLLAPYDIHLPVDPHTTLGSGWWLDIPVSWWKNLGAVEISGGEPLYQQEALEFLDFLASQVPDIWLKIITNTTLINDNIIELFKAIPNSRLLCSVDAWQDDIYNYARRGTHGLDSVKTNMLKLHQHGILFNICDTIHCITYDQYDIGHQWLADNNIQGRHIKNYVYTPEYLDINRALPRSINPDSTEDRSMKFARWIQALDTVRGTNVLTIRPEFEEWFESLKEQLNG